MKKRILKDLKTRCGKPINNMSDKLYKWFIICFFQWHTTSKQPNNNAMINMKCNVASPDGRVCEVQHRRNII